MKTPEEIKSTEAQVWNILKFVIDPEVEVNIVDITIGGMPFIKRDPAV